MAAIVESATSRGDTQTEEQFIQRLQDPYLVSEVNLDQSSLPKGIVQLSSATALRQWDLLRAAQIALIPQTIARGERKLKASYVGFGTVGFQIHERDESGLIPIQVDYVTPNYTDSAVFHLRSTKTGIPEVIERGVRDLEMAGQSFGLVGLQRLKGFRMPPFVFYIDKYNLTRTTVDAIRGTTTQTRFTQTTDFFDQKISQTTEKKDEGEDLSARVETSFHDPQLALVLSRKVIGHSDQLHQQLVAGYESDENGMVLVRRYKELHLMSREVGELSTNSLRTQDPILDGYNFLPKQFLSSTVLKHLAMGTAVYSGAWQDFNTARHQ